MITPAGYHMVIARVRVQQEARRPFLRKPFVRTGQLVMLGAYFFQVGGILGARHARNVDAFGLAFFGLGGPPGAMAKFLSDVVAERVGPRLASAETFLAYAEGDLSGRLGFKGDRSDFIAQDGMRKVWLDPAVSYASQCAEDGAALGAIQPDVFRTLFERTHAPRDPERWEFARKAGLDIPERQPVLVYSETEDDENKLFMEYCRECRPELYATLA